MMIIITTKDKQTNESLLLPLIIKDKLTENRNLRGQHRETFISEKTEAPASEL